MKKMKKKELLQQFNDKSEQDIELLKIYVGDKYDEMINNKFNIWAALLHTLYFSYRKLYLQAFIIASATYFLNGILYITMLILIGLLFNKYYIKKSKIEVVKIKEKYKNKNYEKIKDMCFLKGNGSILSAILGIIIVLIASTIFAFIHIITEELYVNPPQTTNNIYIEKDYNKL